MQYVRWLAWSVSRRAKALSPSSCSLTHQAHGSAHPRRTHCLAAHVRSEGAGASEGWLQHVALFPMQSRQQYGDTLTWILVGALQGCCSALHETLVVSAWKGAGTVSQCG